MKCQRVIGGYEGVIEMQASTKVWMLLSLMEGVFLHMDIVAGKWHMVALDVMVFTVFVLLQHMQMLRMVRLGGVSHD